MKPAPDLRANLIDHRISAYLREMHGTLLEAAELKAGSRILFLDCRDGWAAEEAFRRVGRGQVIGVDPAVEMIELARRYRHIPGCLEFHVWDRSKLPFSDARFDTVLSSFNLHRYRDPEAVIRELARVLAPGGQILIIEPTKFSFVGLYVLIDWIYRLWDPGHVRYHTGKQLESMLCRAGLEAPKLVRRIQHFGLGGKLLATAVLVRCRKPAAPSGS